MRLRGIVTLALFALAVGATSAGAQPKTALQCVRTQCEGKGQACVETTYGEADACIKAARKVCDAGPLSEKAKCLRAGLSPCATTRINQENACLADMRTCSASCGPLDSKRINYWCVGNLDGPVYGSAAFCQVDPAQPLRTEACEQAIGARGRLSTLNCEPL